VSYREGREEGEREREREGGRERIHVHVGVYHLTQGEEIASGNSIITSGAEISIQVCAT
jgi:hypothetical protein